jgi:hypothetical protein
MRPTRILLFQTDPATQIPRNWVEVTMLRRNPQPSDFRTDQDVRDWAVMLAKYSDRGGRRLGPNSVTDSVDTAYTIGTSAPQSEKYWGFSPRRGELDFFERHTMDHIGLR